MDTGDLRTWITIQEKVSGTNENGFPTESYQNVATIKANKRGLSGREYYSAAAVQAENDAIYTIPYRTGIALSITSGMRIKDGTNYFNIKAPPVDIDGRKQWLEIRAAEVTPGVS